MTETPNPQEGVFDHIKGAHSKDPEAVEEPQQQAAEKAESSSTQSAEPEPVKPVEGEGGTEAERLKKHVTRLERQLKNMGPYAQFGLAVAQDKRGKAIADRWSRSGQLFEAEEGPEEGSEEEPRRSLSREELNATLDEREAARRQMDELTELASENLAGFSKLKRSQKYMRELNAALTAVWNDPGWFEDAPKEVQDWEDEVAAKNYTAITRAYKYLMMNSPKVIEAAKTAGKKEATERAEAAMAASVSSGGTTSSSEEPPPKGEADDMIERMLTVRGRGKSFRTVASG